MAKDYTCPNCGHHFTTVDVGTPESVPQGRESRIYTALQSAFECGAASREVEQHVISGPTHSELREMLERHAPSPQDQAKRAALAAANWFATTPANMRRNYELESVILAALEKEGE